MPYSTGYEIKISFELFEIAEKLKQQIGEHSDIGSLITDIATFIQGDFPAEGVLQKALFFHNETIKK